MTHSYIPIHIPPRPGFVVSRCARRVDRDLVPRQDCSRPIVRPGNQAGFQHTKYDLGILYRGASCSTVAAHLDSHSADAMHRDSRVNVLVG